MSMQVPLQSSPLSQEQMPAEHDLPGSQVVPQAPQLALSEVVSVQVPPQSVPLLHSQVPPEHDLPGSQVVPQPPQLLSSEP